MKLRRWGAALFAGAVAGAMLAVGVGAAHAAPQGSVPFAATVSSNAAPSIEIFGEDGSPLGDRAVQPGETITFRGSGFDPQANNPGGSGPGVPLPSDQPQGVFVAFGSIAEPWRPSQGAPAENRVQVRTNTKWVLLDEVVEGLPEPLRSTIAALAVTHNPDGTFEGEIVAEEPERLPENGRFGVYTYAGGATLTNEDQELFVPVNFAAENDGGSTPESPVAGTELVWGFKESWRGYVHGIANGTTVPGAGAEIGADGLFRFALEDASAYDYETGEGVVKYDGRIRFMSSDHDFDIVIEKPWVTFGEGGSEAVLSLGMSTIATVGDLTVTRVDAANLTPGEFVDAELDGEGVRSWQGVEGAFLDTVQPAELSRYVGETIDPVSFAIPVPIESGVDDSDGEEDANGGADAEGAGGSGNDDAEGTEQMTGVDGVEADEAAGVDRGGANRGSGSVPADFVVPGGSSAKAQTLAQTGARGDQQFMFVGAFAVLLAGGLLVSCRRFSVSDS